MHVGERIKSLRKAAGLTQAEFGQRIGIKQSSVSLIEAGNTEELKAGTLVASARLFKVDADWLFSGKGKPQPDRVVDDDEDELLAAFRQLHHAQRRGVIGAAHGMLADHPPSPGNPFPQARHAKSAAKKA